MPLTLFNPETSEAFLTASISAADLKPDSLALRYRGAVGCSPRFFLQYETLLSY